MDLVKNNNIKSKSKTKSKSISKIKSISKSKSASKSSSKNIETLIKSYIKTSVEPYVFYDNFLDNTQKTYFQKPIGIYDPLGENINPLTGIEYQNIYIDAKPIKYDSGPAEGIQVPNMYRNWSYIWTNLPLYTKVTSIVESIRNNNMTIIKAGTGTGKSFLAGRICAQAFNFQKKVLMTLPKKILARETAQTTAMSCDVVVGEEVGYKFKGAHEVDKNGKTSKIIFTTTGTLVRQITGDDPLLKDYSCIIVDEAHERSVQTDQIILFLKKALTQRPDLKVVFISATLDTELFMNYFKDYSCNIVELPPTIATFPIKDIYEKKVPDDWQKTAIEKVIEILRSGESGDILVFIKSGSDANKMRSYLEPQLKTLVSNNGTLKENPFMITLDAGVTKEEQEYATKEFDYLNHPDADPTRPYTRKIVFSTNVAESSLTVKGAVFVVDCGLALEDLYEPKRDASALLEKFVSQSAIKQRRGRVGRTKAGICYHLYSEADMKKFSEYPIPSIQKSDLTMDLLDIMKIEYVKNIGDLKQLLSTMISPPSQIFIDSALHNLYLNGAITSKDDNGTLTPLGRAYSSFSGLNLQMARSIIASYYYHCKYDVIAIMAIIAELGGRIDGLYTQFKPKYKMNESEYSKAIKEHEKKQHRFDSSSGDFLTIHNIYQEFRAFMKIPKNVEVQVPNNVEPSTYGGDAEAQNQNILINNRNKNNNAPSIIPIHQLTPKTAADARKWCLENGISHRTFVDSKNKLSWDKIGNEVRKIEFALMKIVQPPELKRAYFDKYKEDGGMASKKMLTKEIAESKKLANTIEDKEKDDINDAESIEESISPHNKSVLNHTLEGGSRCGRHRKPKYTSEHLTNRNKRRQNYIETNDSPVSNVENPQNKSVLDLTAYGGSYVQFGGYNAKPYEVNYFPDAKLFEKREDNILAAIGHGFYTHMAKHVNKNFYTTCVPIEPVMCYPDMNSTVSLKAKPKYLVYYELFMLRENQPTLKLNIVNKLPTKVQAEIKSVYGKLIPNCYKTIKMKSKNNGKRKDGKKGTRKAGEKGKFFKKKQFKKWKPYKKY